MKRAAGPFEIVEILGEGSFGTVCVARITEDPLRRKVAIKVLKGTYSQNQKVLPRTRDEARMLSQITHPNIVRVERLIELQDRPILVMELVRGVSLDQLLLRFKDGLPVSVALEVGRQTSLALHAAYNLPVGEDGRPLKVIHRDIKPSNIMLSVRGEVKVMDFGIARGEFDGREARTESVVMGSRAYMAPERLDGKPDTPVVDVFSTGMTLFELLTGHTATVSVNPNTHEDKLRSDLGYLRVDPMPDSFRDELRELVGSMCSYYTERRPSSLEVADRLSDLLQRIPAEERQGLEEFAERIVEPIYESRPRISPEQALRNSEDWGFMADITGKGTTAPGADKGRTLGGMSPATLGFVSLLVAMVTVLAVAAGYKILSPSRGEEPDLIDESHAGKVKVKVWFPENATAELGSRILPTTGSAWIGPGDAQLKVSFDDGELVVCPFTASEETALRVFEQGGRRGFTQNDGSFVVCESSQRTPAIHGGTAP
ncbi:MAG: serine/threonine protein kinase [Deltaproteobacteria bacterium]|nr:serine/threonine protein kinase [Deltaproteobacteria bacterium]